MHSIFRHPRFVLSVVLVLGSTLALEALFLEFGHSLRDDTEDGVQISRVELLDPETGKTRRASPIEVAEWRAIAEDFALSLGGWTRSFLHVTRVDRSFLLDGLAVTEGMLSAFEPTILAGRLFGPSDFRPTAEASLVLVDSTALRLFGGAEEAIGETLDLSGNPFRILGVIRLERPFLGDIEAFAPLQVDPNQIPRSARYLSVTLVHDGLADDLLRDRLRPVAATSALDISIEDYRRSALAGDAPALRLFAAAGGLLFALGLASASLLQLARSEQRRTEWSIRLALGARRGRAMARVATETAILALGSAILASLLVAAFARIAPVWLAGPLDRADLLEVDASVVWILAGLAFIAWLVLAGLASLRLPAGSGLGSIRSGQTSDRLGRRVHQVLVVTQIMCAVVLMVLGGWLVEALGDLLGSDLGFRSERLASVEVVLPDSAYPYGSSDTTVFLESAVEALEGLPDVVAASWANVDLFRKGRPRRVVVEGMRQDPTDDERFAVTGVGPEFFQLLEVVPSRGRLPVTGSPDLVINQALADRFSREGLDLLNRGMTIEGLGPRRDSAAEGVVVGVVENLGLGPLEEEVAPAVYLPTNIDSMGYAVLFIRMRGSDINPLDDTVQALEPRAVVRPPRTVNEIRSDRLAERRTTGKMLGVFAALATLVALTGVYGFLASYARRRERELGIRACLGARPRRLFWTLAGEGLALAGLGSLLGAVLIVAFHEPIRRFLDIPGNPVGWTIVALAGIFMALAFASCAVVGRRAARIEPAGLLRDN